MIQDPFRSMIRSEGPALSRPSVAPHARPVYHLAFRGHAAADAGAARGGAHAGVARSLSDRSGACSGRPFRCLGCVAGDGLQSPRLALHRAAQCVVEDWDGEFPRETHDLVALPGIGPATAQGIRSFAFDLPGVYLETNVRTVFLHHFFPDVPAVPDRELVPLIQAACPAAPGAVADEIAPFAAPQDDADTPRAWYYALLDYGAYLKKTLPNPSRRSAGYSRQSKFEGSRRQKRAHIVRMLLAARDGQPAGITLDEAVAGVNEMEVAAGREPVECELVASILADLEREAFAAPRAIVG